MTKAKKNTLKDNTPARSDAYSEDLAGAAKRHKKIFDDAMKEK
ncbi:hypothetical protein N480_23905 [Pseudoalteromonas luteoviolacea S2607]|nr:hypothetical protein [Pseudoalteromonas luteoviolacea]KZN33570.1 hypothetical protein N480_23905 [Pseudoalteromonas luteoviolacea S2607]